MLRVGHRFAAAAAAAAAATATASRCERKSDPQRERVLKRVVFVRHGQGYHNLDGGRGEVFDPALTPKGQGEARAVFSDKTLTEFRPTLALVSPLWRTLQTCTTALREQRAADGHHCAKVVATDDVREHNNRNPCNHRRAISSEHAQSFAEVDFSRLDTDGPPPAAEWVDESYKEAFGLLRTRAARVLAHLAAQPDKDIVVFTHGTFIRGVVCEVLSLNAHHWGACPPTGTPVEVLQIETGDGDRYWELARPAAVDSIGATSTPTAGPSTKRLP